DQHPAAADRAEVPRHRGVLRVPHGAVHAGDPAQPRRGRRDRRLRALPAVPLRGAAAHQARARHHGGVLVHLDLERLLHPARLPERPRRLHGADRAAVVPRLERAERHRADVRDVGAVAGPGVPVLPGVPAAHRRRHQHQRDQGMTARAPVQAAGGWKEQLRRVAGLALLGIVEVPASLPVVTVGAVVATLSSAVGHWVDHDELPSYREIGTEFARRLLPGVPVSAAGVLAVLVVVQQVDWLRAGVVPGGGAVLAVFGVAVACLVAVVLLAVPRLAGGGWRTALAAAWTDLLRAPASGLAALAVTGVAALLAVLLPGVVLVLPALVVLALHAVHRRLVPPRP